MRVSPLNPHYQLHLVVDPDPLLQLDFIKNRVSRGCASFTCFSCGGSASAGGLDTITTTTTTPCPPLKLEPPLQHPVVSPSPPPEPVDVAVSVAVVEKGNDLDANREAGDDDDNTGKEAFKLSLRSSLKRPPPSVVEESRSLEDIKEDETLRVDDDANGGGEDIGRRKVKWPDASGNELTQVREFEPSEMGLSDEEWEKGQQRTCSCVIM